MSLILEALKKSEQQRRLGEAPTLGSPVVSTRRRRSLLPVLAVLIVIGVGAGWWLSRQPAQPTTTPAPPVTAENTVPSKPGDAQATKAGQPAGAANQERLKAEAAKRKVEQAKRIEALGNAKQAPPLGLPNANPPTAAMAPRKPGDPIPHAMPSKAPPGEGATNPAKTDATAAAPKPDAKAPPPVATPPASDSAAATSPAPPKAPAAAAPSDASALPTIWELPFATRKDIPELDLSMHVYSSDPKQRFVVIKGDRHVEGDEVASDLVLREIRQDGLVLEYKGQKFFFPRNGR
jgi:general secretion pathway protein B